MKSKLKKLGAFFAAMCLICTTLSSGVVLPVSAASYSTDYKYWSQGASDYSGMNDYGCWVVAQAKLIYETDVDRSSSFNPDSYMIWEQQNGYLNSGFYQVNGGLAPQKYAESKGKQLTYMGTETGLTATEFENRIWSNISNKYYTLARVITKSGYEHYIMIANDLSQQNGVLYIYNSWKDSATCRPMTLSSCNYTITRLYTYAASNVSSSNLISVVPTQSGKVDVITETNAIVYGTVNKTVGSVVNRFGFRITKQYDDYSSGITYTHAPSRNYDNSTFALLDFNMNNEMNYYLTHATTYKYQFYAQIDGVDYWSEERTLTTLGSHSYGEWVFTKPATCLENGTMERACACGAKEYITVTAQIHSFDNLIETKEPTVSQEGYNKYKCAYCDETYTEVIEKLTPQYMRGDVNGDGIINSTDFMQVRRHFLGLYTIPESSQSAADVNGDGLINSTDFMQIRRHFLGLYNIESDYKTQLIDMDYFLSDGVSRFNKDVRDTYSNYYENCICMEAIRYDASSVTYFLGGEYTRFKGTVAYKYEEYELGADLRIRIFADDVLIYSQTEIDCYTAPFEFDIDVTDCNFMKIVVGIVDDGYTYYTCGNLIIADAELIK